MQSHFRLSHLTSISFILAIVYVQTDRQTKGEVEKNGKKDEKGEQK